MEGMLHYFIPEDGDSLDHMNVIPLPDTDVLRLQHVKQIFPLPGEFHFRFKTPFEGTFVWMDVINNDDVIPDYNGFFISKISRKDSVSTKNSILQSAKKTSADLIETHATDAIRDTKSNSEDIASLPPKKAFHDDLVGLLSDPIPTHSPKGDSRPQPSTPSKATMQPSSTDPFNLFSATTNPVHPIIHPIKSNTAGASPLGSGPNAVTSPVHNFGASGSFSPMVKSPGPSSMNTASVMRPPAGGSMHISQMGQHMGMNALNHPNNAANTQGNNSFQGLQWQGMNNSPGPHQRKW